jgi:hypothetical protein
MPKTRKQKENNSETKEERMTKIIMTVSVTLLSFTLAFMALFSGLQENYRNLETSVPIVFTIGAFFLFITVEACFLTLNFKFGYWFPKLLFFISIFIVFVSSFKTISYQNGLLTIEGDTFQGVVSNLIKPFATDFIGFNLLASFLVVVIAYFCFFLFRRDKNFYRKLIFIIIIFVIFIVVHLFYSFSIKPPAVCNLNIITTGVFLNSTLSINQTSSDYCKYQCFILNKIIDPSDINATDYMLTNNTHAFYCRCDINRCRNLTSIT